MDLDLRQTSWEVEIVMFLFVVNKQSFCIDCGHSLRLLEKILKLPFCLIKRYSQDFSLFYNIIDINGILYIFQLKGTYLCAFESVFYSIVIAI